MLPPSDRPVILFDGICNLCNSSVRFILERDTKEQFLFSSLQSDASKKLLLHLNYKIRQMNSILLVENGQIHEKSEAVLKISARLRFPWNLTNVFRIVPVALRDKIYDLVANNRYRWFGKKDKCVFKMNAYENRFI
jgi:predicted DCC family thiol-disulfide oxidoreductase YuxK